MTYDLESDLKIKAIESAQSMVKEICDSYQRPTKAIVGKSLKFYEEIEAWGLLDSHPITDKKNQSLYVTIFAMREYEQLKREKDHPPQPKKSKWEVVTGHAPRRS